MKLQNTIAIVTGAARGMGAHFARALLRDGASVAAGDVDLEGLQILRKEIGQTDRFWYGALDVVDLGSVAKFVRSASEALGTPNALVNNAGIIRDGLLVKRHRSTGEVLLASEEDLRAVLEVNLVGATRMVQHVAARMVEDGQPGVIVNLSSCARHGNRGQTAYVSAKAALAANCVTWMRELAPHGIRVVAVAPGMVETPMTRGMKQNARDALIERIPCARIGVPHDIYQALRFSIECEYFNGRTIDVDGGLAM